MIKTISITPRMGRWTIVVPPEHLNENTVTLADDLIQYVSRCCGPDDKDSQISLLAEMFEALAIFASTGEASLTREASEALIEAGIVRYQPEPAS